MRTTRIHRIVAVTMLALPALVFADAASDIQDLKDKTAAFEAKKAKDVAEAESIKAGVELAKAKATAANLARDLQRAEQTAEDTAAASEINSKLIKLKTIKEEFGAVPSVGNEGTIAISEQTTGTLLEVRSGSLRTTWEMADKLCIQLRKAAIKDAFIAPAELDLKIQSASLMLREFNALSAKVEDSENLNLVGLGGAQSEVAFESVLGAVSLAQYGAGALQSIAKLFRSDYAVGLSSDATRAGWLEYFLAAKCSDVVPKAHMEAVVRKQSIEISLGKLNKMMAFGEAATATKAAYTTEIEGLRARILKAKEDKKDTKELDQELQTKETNLQKVSTLDAWLPRIQALVTVVQTTPNTFLDALTWYAFIDPANVEKLHERPRLTLALTSQDAQISKTNWFTGQKLYGRSSGELIYRVADKDGKITAIGFITMISPSGRVSLGAGADVADESHSLRP